MEAVRDHSESRGAARTVGFVLASYADKYGNRIYVGLDRIMAEAKVNRKSAVDGRRWFLENGEAELTERPDGKPLMRGRVRVMSMAPLLERARVAEAAEGSESEPLAKGSESEPQPKEGSPSEPLGVRSESGGVRSAPPSSSPAAPDTEGDGTETEGEPEDARAGARDGSISGSSLLPPDTAPSPNRLAAERRETEAEIEKLRAQLPTSSNPERTRAAINALEAQLEPALAEATP